VNDQIPLYLGIPLAAMCTSLVILMAVFAIAIWKDHHE